MIIDVLAGKMNFDGKKVSPDNRKGILRLVIDESPSIETVVKLQWLDRSVDPPRVENEWDAPVIIEEVPAAKTGKVYVVKPSVDSSNKQFIWIQQQCSNAAGEAAGFSSGTTLVDNVDALMNQMQMFSQISSCHDAMEMYSQVFGSADPHGVADDQMLVDLGDHEGHEDDEEDEQLDEMIQQLFEQAGLTGENGEDEDSQIAALLLSNPEILSMCLANVMQALTVYHIAQGGERVVPQQPSQLVPTSVNAVIASSTSLLEESKDRLLSLCPEGESNIQEILKSPQFSECLRSLTEGIYSDQIGVLFTSLGLELPTEHIADPFEALCKALEKKFSKH
jgi:hypothetical protein